MDENLVYNMASLLDIVHTAAAAGPAYAWCHQWADRQLAALQAQIAMADHPGSAPEEIEPEETDDNV